MKYLRNINEWFWSPEEGDDFVKKVIDIIQNENIEIKKETKNTRIGNEYYDTLYVVNIDGEKIIFGFSGFYYIKYNESDVKISGKYYSQIKKIYKEQDRKKRITNLPDFSELGRMSKKYNI